MADDAPDAKRATLRDHGLARMVITTLNEHGEISVTVRAVRTEDLPRIMADLDNSSVG